MGQIADEPVAFPGQLDARDPAVARIRPAPDQSCRHRPMHQFDRAVRAQEQVLGHLADGWRQLAGMALERHQELVLDVGEPGRAGLLLAPVLEPAQGDPEGQEILEISASWLWQRTGSSLD